MALANGDVRGGKLKSARLRIWRGDKGASAWLILHAYSRALIVGSRTPDGLLLTATVWQADGQAARQFQSVCAAQRSLRYCLQLSIEILQSSVVETVTW